jgi:hypothetical protein
MTPAQYMAALVPIAQQFVGAIHGDGPDAASRVLTTLHAMPHPPSVCPSQALMTVLAAMVDPDKPPSETLAWVQEPTPARLARLQRRIEATA